VLSFSFHVKNIKNRVLCLYEGFSQLLSGITPIVQHLLGLCDNTVSSHTALKRLSQDLNTGATIQADPSREIYIKNSTHYITIHYHDGSNYPVRNE